MTLPHRAQIALECTPYYHCIARRVRRAFVSGRHGAKSNASCWDFSASLGYLGTQPNAVTNATPAPATPMQYSYDDNGNMASVTER